MICRRLFSVYAEFLQLVLSSILWATAHTFAANLRHGENQESISVLMMTAQVGHMFQRKSPTSKRALLSSWDKVGREYYAIKKFSRLINTTLGTRTTLNLLRILLYYAVVFDSVKDWQNVVFQGIYFAGSSVLLLLSADICYQA